MRLLAICIAVTLGGDWAERPPGASPVIPADPIPASYFGLHIHRAVSTLRFPQAAVWPSVGFAGWRLWDAGVAWPQLEPSPGTWHFDELDHYVALADSHHVEILLTLALSPTWASARPEEPSGYAAGNAAEPKSMTDWRDYVRTVATRYRGRIRQYEIWNEPNLKQFFTGDIETMVRLVAVADTVLKEVDSNNVLVSPPATTYRGVRWLDAFLAAGGGRYVDVIGFHFYVSPQPPEAMAPLIDSVWAIIHRNNLDRKPLWNSETGWFIANRETLVAPVGTGNDFRSKVLTDSEASAYVARAFTIAWAHNVRRFYWYAWDNTAMGLTEADGQKAKAPATAYSVIHDWLVGRQMISCRPDSTGTWVADLIPPQGGHEFLVWRPQGLQVFPVAGYVGVAYLRDLKNGGRALTAAERTKGVVVGPLPLLLQTHKS